MPLVDWLAVSMDLSALPPVRSSVSSSSSGSMGFSFGLNVHRNSIILGSFSFRSVT